MGAIKGSNWGELSSDKASGTNFVIYGSNCGSAWGERSSNESSDARLVILASDFLNPSSDPNLRRAFIEILKTKTLVAHSILFDPGVYTILYIVTV